MKKIIFAGFVLFVTACNGNGNSSSADDTTITNSSGVENVNGNIPDTTNTITVEGSSQAGNNTADTLQKK